MRLSVVIGYKDWGIGRLIGAVRSLRAATSEIDAEIIVSDYGSTDSIGHLDAIEAEGAIYVRTDTDGVWSRSRALNAGLAIAGGEVLVTTDADMVFSPKTFEIVLKHMSHDPLQYVVMQCNDLPEGIGHDDIENGKFSWNELYRLATLRPRWGMGGMIAVPREAYFDSRGLDERMAIYGGEDIDFARRMRRLGLKLHWLNDSEAQMYHVWHPSSRVSADETTAGRRAIARNREIQLTDKTAARNLTEWQFAPVSRPPVVSVVISTHNRAEYLRYAILSTLAQTMSDFELIIIDDGSTDDTRAVVESFTDARIRYFPREQAGLASARNFATSIARAKYIAVMDDDDIMLPTRLENSLAAIVDGANGSYGGWIDYNDSNGVRSFRTGKKLTIESLLFNGGTYLHPTLMVERRWMEAVPYDVGLRSGSDYNMAIRMLRCGIRLAHSGEYLLMRRVHDGQITALDPSIQKASGAISAFWGRATMLSPDVRQARADRESKDKTAIAAQRLTEPTVLEYLPDSAVARRAMVRKLTDATLSGEAREILREAEWARQLETIDGRLVRSDYIFETISLASLLVLRSAKHLEVIVETRVLDQSAAMSSGDPIVMPAIEGEETIQTGIVDAIHWLRKEDPSYFAGRAMLIQGPSSAVAAAAEQMDAPSSQFVWSSSVDRTSFSIVPLGEVDLTTAIEKWRTARTLHDTDFILLPELESV